MQIGAMTTGQGAKLFSYVVLSLFTIFSGNGKKHLPWLYCMLALDRYESSELFASFENWI